MTNNLKKYGKYSADDLRMLIGFLPTLEIQYSELLEILEEKKSLVFNEKTVNWYWFGYYEKPFLEHCAIVAIFFGMRDTIKEWSKSENPAQTMLNDMVDLSNGVDKDDGEEDSEVPDNQKPAVIPLMLGLSYSLICTLRCLLIYGFYLNELMDIAKNNLNNKKGDKAILQAIRIDKTVMGSKTVIGRISRAVLSNDQNFLKKLNSAMQGKLGKREADTYQKMRFVLQALLEAGAPKLNDKELKELFAKELNLISDSQHTAEKNAAEFARNFKKI